MSETIFKDRVRIDRQEHVAEAVMIRGDKANALDLAMFEALHEAGESLKGDPSLRAVILRGEGKHFCAGLDLSRLKGRTPEQFREHALKTVPGSPANLSQMASYIWKELEVPVIAVLQGVAFGGGCQIALGADIRVAAPDARLSIMEIKWGLVPDMGLTAALPRLVRMDVAKELIFTGRIVEAEEALKIGLVTRIEADPLAKARELAGFIALKNPDAIRRGKRLLEESWTASPKDGLHLEALLQSEIYAQPNQKEAVMAETEKRAPNYS